MRMRLIPAGILVAYSAILVKILVLKDIPTIRIGHLMLNFGGTESGRPANLIPFSTIVPYLFGHKGLIIAGINLVGNVVLPMPLGLLAPFVFRAMTWRTALVFAAATGLVLESIQAVLRIGIFDIDDVLLNGLGVMIGYAIGAFFVRKENA